VACVFYGCIMLRLSLIVFSATCASSNVFVICHHANSTCHVTAKCYLSSSNDLPTTDLLKINSPLYFGLKFKTV
jgi:hypothetical protein